MFIFKKITISLLVCCSKNELIKGMWPEGALSVTSVTKRPVTAGTEFKNSIITLVENLAAKVGKHFGLTLVLLKALKSDEMISVVR